MWPFGDFRDVPQLGAEPVLGTGCGGEGELGDEIPDGLWAGYITNSQAGVPAFPEIDLLCVYTDEAQLPQSANVVQREPGYIVVNNSTQTRAMPMDGQIVLRLGVPDPDGRCVDGTTTVLWSDIAPDKQVWIRIHNGVVTWVFAGC